MKIHSTAAQDRNESATECDKQNNWLRLKGKYCKDLFLSYTLGPFSILKMTLYYHFSFKH